MRNFFRRCYDPAADGTGGTGGAGGDKGGAPDPLLGGGGKAAGSGGDTNPYPETDYRHGLPEDLRNHTAIRDIKDVPNLVKSFINAQQMVGADKVALINEKSTPEQVAEFYKKLGRPDSADGYKFDPKTIPDGTVQDKVAFTKFVSSTIHKYGLSEKNGQGLMKDVVEYLGAQSKATSEADVKAQTEWIEGLKKEYGAAFDQKIAIGNAALKKFGGEEVINLLRSTGLGSHPGVVKMFVNMGQKLMDDKILDGSGNPTGAILSPSEAKSRIAQLKSDTEFIKKLYGKTELGHEQAVLEWDNLHKVAFPD